MNTVQTWEIESTSLGSTLEIASQVGQKLKGGEVIVLVSDLGGGKTTFVKGIARGMGVTDLVSSPSFAISNQYKARDLTLHHLDFYRLGEAGLMTNALKEVIENQTAVVAIEWADLVEAALPPDRLTIEIHAIDETSRRLKFSYADKLKYLIPANT